MHVHVGVFSCLFSCVCQHDNKKVKAILMKANSHTRYDVNVDRTLVKFGLRLTKIG